MNELLHLAADPAAWAALVTLIVMEVVLGIDNLVFISILSNKLPLEHRQRVRRIGISLALIMRLVLLSTIAFIVGLVHPVFDLGIAGPLSHGEPTFETAFSWRDLILIAGGLFLIYKSTGEIHQSLEGEEGHASNAVKATFSAVILQIMVVDIVFSLDSIITAVGMVDRLEVMITAVILSVGLMMVFASTIGRFVSDHPTIKMLALSFLVVVGVTLIAEGFDHHVPKGYIYFAMAFSIGVEMLNIRMRKRAKKPAELHAAYVREAEH
jgi:predicted tellurium resistance membrane protein TerC